MHLRHGKHGFEIVKVFSTSFTSKWHEGHIEIVSILKHRTIITQHIPLNLAVTEVNVEVHISIALLAKR